MLFHGASFYRMHRIRVVVQTRTNFVTIISINYYKKIGQRDQRIGLKTSKQRTGQPASFNQPLIALITRE